MPILKPNPGQQTFALQQPYSTREILYGGARGGGKTFAGLLWLTEYVDHPRFRGLVIRRNGDDLSDWLDRARYTFSGLGGVVVGKPAIIRFPSGATIRTGHLSDESTYTKYQGHEYQKILIEELTQIPTESRYLKLISSNRTTVPELKPQIFATANPGGVGHMWVKERFIDPSPPNRTFVVDKMSRVFIPATIDDNPVLMDNDPGYVNTLEALKTTDEALYKAWRFGDWNIFVGQVFSEWRPIDESNRPYHVIPHLPFDVMADGVKRYIGMDWGFGHDPATLEWIAVTPPNDYGVRHYYCYREMTDLRTEPEEWIRRIADVVSTEPSDGFILPGDAYFHKDQRNTIADRMEYELKRIQQFNPNIRLPIIKGVGLSHSERVNRQTQLHSLLAVQADGEPGLQVTENCRELIKTIPSLPYSETDPETIETKKGVKDHWYDALTYALYYIQDRPKPVEPRLSQDDILNNRGAGYELIDLRPEYEFTKDQDWRSR